MSDNKNSKITREELSELVWAKPLAQAAEELGVTRGSLISMCNILAVARPKQSYWAKLANGETQAAKRVQLRVPRAHSLIRGAKEHFNHCRPVRDDGYKSGYLKPYKKMLVDITTSKDSLDKALRFANDLFNALESAGHRVGLAPRDENLRRATIDERESGRKGHRSYFDQLWSPKGPTVAYINRVAVGLAVIEMSEEVLFRYVGSGKYIRESDYIPSSRYHTDSTWTTTRDTPSGRFRLLAYSPHYHVQWSTTWQDTKDRSLQSDLKQIVKSLEGAASEIAVRLEEASRQAEIERLEQLAAEERRKREEDKLRAQQSIKDSQEHLGQIIQQWSNVMNVERFLAGAEEHAADLPETERNAVLERLRRARQFLGTQDPLDFLRSWKTPEERYQRRYSDE